MFLALVFLLNVLVYGGCHLVREEENATEKSNTRPKPTSPNCASFADDKHAESASKLLLQEIYKVIRHYEDLKATQAGAATPAKTLADYQLAFLYIHGTSPDSALDFGSDYVQNVFALRELLPFVNGYWPTSARTSNFLLGVPKPAASGVPNSNVGHAEKNILVDWPKMTEGYLNRHNNICPCYVVLGTVKTPCNFGDAGCAVDYVAAKQSFTASCPNTRYYLYVDRKPTSPYLDMWRNTQKLMPAYGIRIFTNFK